jgi:glyoxylate/hydroxypyruvate reductase A
LFLTAARIPCEPPEMAAVLFHSTSNNADRWRAALAEAMPELEFRLSSEPGDKGEIEYALVWKPPAGLLGSLPRLKVIASLGAGVDHVFSDPTLPDLPVVRLVDPHMVAAMSEYVVTQVLRLHRQDLAYATQQRRGEWRERRQPNAEERRVGILGLGTMGTDAALKLKALGFDVAGWSRRPKDVPGVRSYAGDQGLEEMLAKTQILVCLLPLTADTEGILSARLFARLPKGAMLLNAGRGAHLVEEDLIPALGSGQLSGVVLDVFRQEPLPSDHPFWRDERIVVTPHVAAATNPRTAALIVADTFRRARDGKPLLNVVDRAARY